MANTIGYGQGAVNNTNSWGQGAKVGSSFSNLQSLEFDGVDDYVTMGNVLDQPNDGSGAFSISLWSKTNSVGSNEVLIGKNLGSGTYNGYQILKTNTGKLRFFIGSGLSPTARIIADSSSLIYGADWKHIVVTYDGSQDISGVNMYINGVSETIINTANQTPQNVSNTVDFQIGARDGSNLPFNGLLDEVAYFNTELIASDVTNIYNSGTPNDISSVSGLVSWWRFEGTGTTATDSGSGGNNGTLTNGVTRSTDVPT